MNDYLVIILDETGGFATGAGLINKAGQWQKAVPVSDISSVGVEQAIAVLSGAGVAVWRESLPKLPQAKLQKIIPGMMEDRLADGSGNMHFAVWPLGEKNEQLVAAVAQDVMDRALATMRRLGVEPTSVVPDFMLLATGESAQVLTGPEGLCQVRLPDGTGFTAEESLAETMLVEAAAQPSGTSWHHMLGAAVESSFNLQQGRYAGRTDITAWLLWFRRAGLLAVAALLLWVAMVSLETSRLQDEADATYAEAEALFRASFPDVKRIANLRAQARQEVMKLRQQSGGEFLKLSNLLFEQTSAQEGSLLEGLRFDNARGELAATISFTSFADGEAFKKSLTQNGVMVLEGGSRQEGARVVTDLTLRSPS
ncbi:type II secretion system protein GspL [Kordiimonas aestuarii]|uniref:type II secretion system protein GspL n=1 Tax=Kordiimonas aestuarii TaxID=1005925 RepID=UPI0021D21BFC|nr:type II secretion system protein GspL [Kordiimonas aestuarii]